MTNSVSLTEVRNEEACCGNCAYGFLFKEYGIISGDMFRCRKSATTSSTIIKHAKNFVCGDHPEFWIIDVSDEYPGTAKME